LAEKQAVLTIQITQPFIDFRKQKNNRYSIEVTDSDKKSDNPPIKALKYDQYMVGNFRSLVQEIFGLIRVETSDSSGNKHNGIRNDDIRIDSIDSFTFKVSSKKIIKINKVDNNCYDLLGINIAENDKNLILYPQQLTRILTDGKFDLSYFSQTSLLSNNISNNIGHWKYKSFEDKPQDVIIDLARAPLCK
jgi:hypothetical protein